MKIIDSHCHIHDQNFPIPCAEVFENMKTAVIVGSAMASFTVEKFGTERLLEVSPMILKQRIKKFQELTTFEVDLKI